MDLDPDRYYNSDTYFSDELLQEEHLITSINNWISHLTINFHSVNNIDNILLKIVRPFSGYILMIPEDNNYNTNIISFDNTCNVNINNNIYCLHPLENNFINKIVDSNNNIKYYLNIYNNYNSINSYKQFDLSSNNTTSNNYETNKFYLGVNIGNYILDISETSGAAIDMEGTNKSNIEIYVFMTFAKFFFKCKQFKC